MLFLPEARCVCKEASWKDCQDPTFLDSSDTSKTHSTMGTMFLVLTDNVEAHAWALEVFVRG